MRRKKEDQELLLEHWLECLGDGTVPEPIEEDSLERTKSCVWGMVSSNACGDPGSQVPQAAGFLELGRTVRAGEAGGSAHPKWRPSQQTLRYIRMEGLPSAESHPQPPGLGEGFASPSPS